MFEIIKGFFSPMASSSKVTSFTATLSVVIMVLDVYFWMILKIEGSPILYGALLGVSVLAYLNAVEANDNLNQSRMDFKLQHDVSEEHLGYYRETLKLTRSIAKSLAKGDISNVVIKLEQLVKDFNGSKLEHENEIYHLVVALLHSTLPFVDLSDSSQRYHVDLMKLLQDHQVNLKSGKLFEAVAAFEEHLLDDNIAGALNAIWSFESEFGTTGHYRAVGRMMLLTLLPRIIDFQDGQQPEELFRLYGLETFFLKAQVI